MNIVWRRSSYDQQVHAFRPEQVAEAGRGYLEAICSHSLPPAVLEPVAHVAGPWSALLEPSACLPCLATISDLLVEAGRQTGTAPP